MKIEITSHQNGDLVIPKDIIKNISDTITTVKAPIKRYGTKEIKKEILNGLYKFGWTDGVIVHPESKITITSKYEKIGLCLQTGNMGRMYADLLKMQTLFNSGDIIAGIIVLPNAQAAHMLGSNIANANRFRRELEIFNNVITMHMLVISFSD